MGEREAPSPVGAPAGGKPTAVAGPTQPPMIDLRSDTVTRPTAAMRRAMADAEVGDDVYGEDPTVARLEARVAELLGKEAALFVPSGVMGNQLALKVHTQPADEVIAERGAHVVNYESGAGGLLSGVGFALVDGERGHLTPEGAEGAVRAGYYWEPRSRLVWSENTANRAGGTVLRPAAAAAVADVARRHGLGLHLDGARLWNAAVALGTSEAELAAPFDTVSVCLSKGLGAPVGSVLAGPRDLVRDAHRYRKMWGGGMRQVGILAAAGLHALDHHRARLADDHARARAFAEGLAALPRLAVDLATVETNIVMVDVPGPAVEAAGALAARGVRVSPFGPRRLRATFHLDVSDADVDAARAAFAAVFV